MDVVKLNLVMTYPVKWTVHQVLRDFIQNFFDSIGPEKFGKKFTHIYRKEAETLTMISNRGFALDWLMYIGASSKRDGDKKQVGKFGEGFKIASLVGLRDYHWRMTMESRDWRILVTEAVDRIADQEVRVLAYETDRRPYIEEAVLTIEGVSAENYEAFQSALSDFWYKGSSAFGEEIIAGQEYVVYHAPEGRRGALYAGYLRRAYLNEPLIICNHRYKSYKDTRERGEYYESDIINCITDIVTQLSPGEGTVFLNMLEDQWSLIGGRRQKSYEGFDWHKVVEPLINCIASDSGERQRFIELYGNKLIADFPRDRYGNKRAHALQWRRANPEYRERRLVYAEFEKLGIDRLDDVCLEHGGYETLRYPTVQEERYLNILRRISEDIFAGFTCYGQLPVIRIIINRPLQAGSAHCMSARGRRQKNKFGVSVQSEISSIQIRSMFLLPGQFSQAVAIFMHELLHQFGGDGCAQFRKMIMEMCLQMVRKADRLAEYEHEWEQIGIVKKSGEVGYAGI